MIAPNAFAGKGFAGSKMAAPAGLNRVPHDAITRSLDNS
jgi:hypothetical protein